MSFIIFDTEYTSWQGCQEHGWQGNQKKEIVQISALKISDNLDIISEYSAFCKPQINTVLSDYFINLTHITNDKIQTEGQLFSDVYKSFEEFIEDNICYSHSWGTDYFHKSDGLVLEENLSLYKLSPKKHIIYRNIAPLFKELYTKQKIHIKSQSSGDICNILGIEQNLEKLGLNKHNALYDVYSILEGLKYFYPHSVEFLKRFEKKGPV